MEDNPDERGPYFQGDILYPVLPMTKNGVLDEERYWPGGRVPFVIEGNFSELNIQENSFLEKKSEFSFIIL